MADLVDITSPAILGTVHKDVRPAVRVAASLGWTGRRRGRGGLLLYSPDGEHTVQAPQTIGDSHTVKNIAREVLRYTPEAIKLELAHQIDEGSLAEDAFQDAETVIEAGAGIFPGSMLAHLEPEQALPVIEPEPLPKTLVSEKPWMARVSSDGRRADLYESDSVLERVWSDGTTDYLCPVCRVYHSDGPRSVAGHKGKAHTQKGQTPKTTAYLNPTVVDAPVDGFNTVRVAGLAREIEAALVATGEPGAATTAEFARTIAAHIVQARMARGLEKVEEDTGPLTDADLVARVRRLLLRDEMDRLQRAETEASNLRAQVAEVEAEKTAAVERWTALRELVNGN